MDQRNFSSVAGDFRLGALAHGSQRISVWHLLCGRGFRQHDQRHPEHKLGTPAEFRSPDLRRDLAEAVPCRGRCRGSKSSRKTSAPAAGHGCPCTAANSTLAGLHGCCCRLCSVPAAFESPPAGTRGCAGMSGQAQNRIVFENVSKFYGEVLGVNRVNLSLSAGVTSLVGPNGSGKTTLMNLMTGLIRPTNGAISVLGIAPSEPEKLARVVGYCTQFDSFPPSVTGREFIQDWLRLHGFNHQETSRLAEDALARVELTEAAGRKIAGYSKGMRQRIRLAQAISHHPTVLILDEPLNGLDPKARAASMALFEALGKEGMHVVISSHILHEVDRISDEVVLISSGYIVAE